MAPPAVVENLPPPLNSSAEQLPLFDGTTKLYTCYTCPFAQRVWITRNCKGLQDEIKLVPLNLQDMPAWYKEKVYPMNKVPALEDNGEIVGDSLHLIKYVDSNFEGPSLFPDDPKKRQLGRQLWSYVDKFMNIDPKKRQLGRQLWSYVDKFMNIVYTSFYGEGPKECGSAFDHLEGALRKFEDGPFFLGQFSRVDIAYIPFVERFQVYLSEVWKYDITASRPKLAAWIEEMNKIDAYKQTKTDPIELVEHYKMRFTAQQ